MRITVIGTGYVGLVTGTCLSEIGHTVICVDNNKDKIEKLRRGIPPIYEENLETMLKDNIRKGRLSFSESISHGVTNSKIVIIAVGTPSLPNGDVDMSMVHTVAKNIGESMNGYKIIVNKSTVPVGTAKEVREIIKRETKDKSFGFDVVSNPEFLKESTAIHDTFNGERIVIGSNSKRAIRIMKELYSPFNIPFLITKPESSEMIKYASNAYLATKISFINEIALVCEKVGANVKDVAEGMGMDKRIGKSFLNAGIGFGGACFPKDVNGLIKIGEKAGCNIRIARETLEVNNIQRLRPVKILKEYFGSIKDKKIGLLGLAFKAGTDDMREAPSNFIIEALTLAGASIYAYDPIAIENAKRSIKHSVNYCDSVYSVSKGCDAVLLLTDWPEFSNMDLGKIKRLMKGNVFVDGRNVLNPKIMRSYGFRYFSIGVTKNNFNRSNYFMKFAKELKHFKGKSNKVMPVTI